MNNFQIHSFYKNLCDLINNSGLPVATAFFIIKDVLNDLEKIYNKAVEADATEQFAIETKETDLIKEFSEEE